MSDHMERAGASARPELFYELEDRLAEVHDRPRSLAARLADNALFRKTLVLLVLAVIWEVYAS